MYCGRSEGSAKTSSKKKYDKTHSRQWLGTETGAEITILGDSKVAEYHNVSHYNLNVRGNETAPVPFEMGTYRISY